MSSSSLVRAPIKLKKIHPIHFTRTRETAGPSSSQVREMLMRAGSTRNIVVDVCMEPAQKTILPNLFRLKYREGIIKSLELADWLNLPVDETITCERLLDAHLHKQLGEITPERLQFVCSECLEARVVTDPERSERCCAACGAVESDQFVDDLDDSLPFDQTYAPTSSIAVCKSTGDTLNSKEQQQVLATGTWTNGNKEDLPLRAKQIRIMTRTEHPVLDGLMKKAMELSKKFHLEYDHVFGNDLGRNVRRAFWVSRELDLKLTKKGLVDTVFYVTLAQHNKIHIAEIAKNHLKIEPRIAKFIIRTDNFVKQLQADNEVDAGLNSKLWDSACNASLEREMQFLQCKSKPKFL